MKNSPECSPLLLFPTLVREFCLFLIEQGGRVVWVGGGPRDALRGNWQGELNSDFDFELRFKNGSCADQWIVLKKKLIDYAEARAWKITHHPLEIIKFIPPEPNSLTIELSLPRKEIYFPSDHPQSNHHLNFSAQFDLQLSDEEAFQRRDFTCNAIGMEFWGQGIEEWRIVDPFQGVQHLQQGVLEICSDQFAKDPVRFLRYLRFEHKLQLRASQHLLQSLPSFHLQHLSLYYLLQEAQKDGCFWQYLSLFFEKTQEYSLQLSPIFREFFSFPWFRNFQKEGKDRWSKVDYNLLPNEIKKMAMVIDLVFLMGDENQEMQIWAQSLQIKLSQLQQLLRWKKVFHQATLNPQQNWWTFVEKKIRNSQQKQWWQVFLYRFSLLLPESRALLGNSFPSSAIGFFEGERG